LNINGRGNPKLIGFGHSKESRLECQNAVISEGSLEIQSGTAVEALTNTTVVTWQDKIVVTSNLATPTYQPTGTAGAEIGFAYILNNDDSLGTEFEQMTGSVTTGHFTYNAGTNILTFYAGDIPTGTTICIFYHPTVTSAKKFTNKVDVFAKNVKVIADGLFRDICTGEDYKGQLIFYKAKTSEEYNLEINADGEPAVTNLSFEALKACGNNNVLWDLIIFDSADVT
jgi:hypothetical protein